MNGFLGLGHRFFFFWILTGSGGPGVAVFGLLALSEAHPVQAPGVLFIYFFRVLGCRLVRWPLALGVRAPLWGSRLVCFRFVFFSEDIVFFIDFYWFLTDLNWPF